MIHKGIRQTLSCLCAGVILLQVLSAGAFANAANDDAQAYQTTQAPGFSYNSTGSDYVSGKDFYVLKNNSIQIDITSNAVGNNAPGTLTAGALTDMVDLSCGRENVDWGAMYLSATMDASWNNTAARALDLPNISVGPDGKSITAEGAFRADSSIAGKLVYSLVDDKVGVVRMDLTLTNTGAADYNGYFEYLFDPDESGEQVSYTPGVGYTTSKNTVITEGWDQNYLFNGPKGKTTGNTAHTIIWPQDQQPAGLVNEGYISGAWFNADLPAGGSKTITFYHAVTVPHSAAAPYEEAEMLAGLISAGVDLGNYDTLTGKVYDFQTNQPVRYAQVVAKYAVGDKQGQTAGTAATDADGNYSMFVEKDVYTLTASMLDYAQQSASIDMTKVAPELDLPVESFSGARASKGISLGLFGSGVEAGIDDYVMENNNLAASVADASTDSQIPFTRGRIRDMSTKTQGSDGLDWIYTSWLSGREPVEDDGDAGTNEGDQWDQRTTRFDTIEVTQNTDQLAQLTATGVYAADLSGNPDSQQAELTQVMDIEPDSDYITVTTTVKNTSGAELSLYAGDVLDYDIGGTQATYIPGVGQLSNGYDSPMVVTPSEPWVAQFGDGAAKQVYAMIYDNSDIKAFGSVNWVGAYAPVTLAADGSYTYTRKLFVGDSSAYSNYWDAVSAFIAGQELGYGVSVDFDDQVYAPGDYVDFQVSVTNNSQEELNGLTCRVSMPYLLVSADGGELAMGGIAPGESKTYTVRARAVEAGRGKASFTITSGAGIPLSFERYVSVSGAGWYGGDDHSHTVYSDGSGTVKSNTDVAYEKGLSWLYSTDHNSIRQYADTETITDGGRGDFLSIAGNELTSNIGHALGYCIPYADSSVYAVKGLTKIASAADGQRTWQDVIDEVNADGGFVYVAHPNYPGLQYPDIYDIRNFTGIEVWNGFYHALDNVNRVALDYWDSLNSRGEKKYYGIANSDAHNSGKIGDPCVMVYLPSLSIDNVNQYLQEGNCFGTNGPQLRFDIDGVGMGQALKIAQDGETVRINLRAFDQKYDLTGVTLYKSQVTGSAELNRETVQSWDLTGLGLREWSATVELPAHDGEFYRIELTSEKGTTGTGGAGTGSGTGFAFSNPIWIEAGGQNAAEVTGLTYGTGSAVTAGQGGNYYILANPADTITADRLTVGATSGADVEKSYDADGDVLRVTVTSADGTHRTDCPIYIVRSEKIAPQDTLTNVKNAVDSLKETINGLDLNKGVKNSLTVKLDHALKSYEGDKNNADNLLNAFTNEVAAQLAGGNLTDEQAAALTEAAQSIASMMLSD